MKQLQFNEKKVLKLKNVLKTKLILDDNEPKFDIQIEQMKSYIKMKGAVQIGPLIQYMNPFMNNSGQIEVEVVIMLQCDNYIHNVEIPYVMNSVLRVPNCMYCRYIGPEDKLKIAYDKINVTAFEEDIPLKGDSYTIFVDQQDDNIIADVFMERAEE